MNTQKLQDDLLTELLVFVYCFLFAQLETFSALGGKVIVCVARHCAVSILKEKG